MIWPLTFDKYHHPSFSYTSYVCRLRTLKDVHSCKVTGNKTRIFLGFGFFSYQIVMTALYNFVDVPHLTISLQKSKKELLRRKNLHNNGDVMGQFSSKWLGSGGKMI